MGAYPPFRGPRRPANFVSNNARRTTPWVLIGQCITASGNKVAGAKVNLFDFYSNAFIATTTSDANGLFTFNPPTNNYYYCTFFLAGTPDQFGRTGRVVPS